jgi:hypothetical protein
MPATYRAGTCGFNLRCAPPCITPLEMNPSEKRQVVEPLMGRHNR